jgi:hypothetical protein
MSTDSGTCFPVITLLVEKSAKSVDIPMASTSAPVDARVERYSFFKKLVVLYSQFELS